MPPVYSELTQILKASGDWWLLTTFKPDFNAGNYGSKQSDSIGRCYSGGYLDFYSKFAVY